MNNSAIGVFDSGVGGLSILLELQKLLPDETFIFLADQAHIPYGEKTKKELVERVYKILNFFETQNVKMVIMACNTATVYAIDEAREKFMMPIVGTVPVVKTLKDLTKTGKTAVFSTPATAKSNYLTDLIQKFAPDIDVIKVGGSNLEDLIEEGNLDRSEVIKALSQVLKPVIDSGVDTIALGCTHYPFLRDKIQNIVGPRVIIVDSGGAVARRVRDVLTNNKSLSDKKREDLYYTTGDKSKFKQVAGELTGKKLKNVQHINL